MIEYFILGAFGVAIGVFVGFILCRRFCVIPAHRPQPQQPPQPQLQPQQQFQQPLPMPAPPQPVDDGFRPYGEVATKSKAQASRPVTQTVDTEQRNVKYTTKGQPYIIQPDGKAKFIKKSEVKS